MTTFEEIRLGDLVPALTITKGFPTQRALPEGDVRVMSVAALRNTASPKHFAERDAIADLGLELAQPGDVLVAIEGGTVGETLVVPTASRSSFPLSRRRHCESPTPRRLDPWYLGAWSATEPAREQLRRLARGLGIQRIPIKDLASLIVRVPPLQDQREIGDRFRAFENAIQSHRAVTACLEELREPRPHPHICGHRLKRNKREGAPTMITGAIKSQVDKVWDAFWSGGISNPLEVIEQITYLLFLRRLDDMQVLEENKATRLKKPVEHRIFPEGKDELGRPYEDLRWSRFQQLRSRGDVYGR